MKLYDLTEAYAQLVAQLDECGTAEEESAVLAQIDALGVDIAEKAEAYARIMRNKMNEAAGCDTEIKRLTARKKSAENAVARLKEYLLYAMGIAGATEINTSIGKWRIQKNAPSVVICDEAAVPEEFTVPQPPKVMKIAIMQHFKQTGEIPSGCDIVQTDSVRFR